MTNLASPMDPKAEAQDHHRYDAGATRPSVAIIGAGISGMVAADVLAEAGAHVVLIESSNRLGGKIQTDSLDRITIDVGPDSFFTRKPEAVELCYKLGLSDQLVAPAQSRAYIWSRGRLRPMPAGLTMGAPSRLTSVALSGILSPRGTLRAGLDFVLPRTFQDRKGEHCQADHAIGELISSRMGREAASNLVDPLAGGVHAGSSFELSAAMVFPQLLDAAREHRSLIIGLRSQAARSANSKGLDVKRPLDPRAASRRVDHPRTTGTSRPMFLGLRGGLATVVDVLGDELKRLGVDIRLQLPARSLSATKSGWVIEAGSEQIAADAVIVASPAPSAARLLSDVASDAAAILADVEHASVGILTMSYPSSALLHPPAGTGFLVPASAGMLVTACTWLSTKWPHLAEPGRFLIRASVGRSHDTRFLDLDDSELLRAVSGDLAACMNLRTEPTEAKVTRWLDAFPQYRVGHLRKITDVNKALSLHPRIALTGPVIAGAGIPACIAQARATASRIATSLGLGEPRHSDASGEAPPEPPAQMEAGTTSATPRELG